MRLTRRRFLAGAAALAAAAWGVPRALRRFRPPVRRIEGRIVGASHALGHRLREGGFGAPSEHLRTGVVVAGAGIAGLAAAWRLRRAGVEDLLVLDLEPEPGGTSRGGPCPWGAHYLPVPGRKARAVRLLLEEIGAVRSWTPAGEPVYEETVLCAAPQERLYLHGRWQEGLFPSLGAFPEDLRQRDAFRAEMAAFREGGGFSIPLDLSRPDPELDRMSMAGWMTSRGYTSPRLGWWVDYGCRDDFGCSAAETSAWAGIHYFASREDSEVLVWPEGNARLASAMARGLGDRVRTGILVHRIEEARDGVEVDALQGGRGIRIRCDRVVAALPRFILRRLAPAFSDVEPPSYAPWVVANLSLDRPPAQGRRDAPLSWDNVLYDSPSLGYVNARQQSLGTAPGPAALTWYRPFAGQDPAAARARMLATPWEGWRDEVLSDLSRPHPDLRDLVSRIDVMLWGHGMVRPVPGLIWGEARGKASLPRGRIHPAHSDLSGMALFEEAQYRGVKAAEDILAAMGKRSESIL